MLSFVAVAVFLLIASWNCLRSVATVGIVATLTAVMVAAAFRLSHRRAVSGEMIAVVVGNAMLAALLFANALARSRRDAQRQVEIEAWHLRQLLPASAVGS